MGMRPAKFSAESVEWYTPSRYLEAARAVLGAFDLDPASCPEANVTVRAERILTQAENGLAYEWTGRVWLNPPYTRQGTGAWVAKLFDSYVAGQVTSAIMLVNATTDRKWFSLLWEADALCFTDHRIQFVRPGEPAQQPVCGNVFAYLGQDVPRFAEAFRPFGAIVRGLP